MPKNTGYIDTIRAALAEPRSLPELARATGLAPRAVKSAVANLTGRGEARVVGHKPHPHIRREVSVYQLASVAPNPWDCRALLEIAGPRAPSWMGAVRKVRNL